MAPELVLPFVNPQELVLHRLAVIGRPQACRAAVLAVPAMIELVGDDVAVVVLGLPFDEALRIERTFVRALMLEPDPAELVGQGDEEIVVIEVEGAVHGVGFFDQLLERCEMLGREFELLRLVGDGVELDVVAEIPLAGVLAGEDGRIDQLLVIDLRPGHGVALALLPVERSEYLPAGREGHGRLDGNLPHEIARRIEADGVPLQVEHLRGHHDAPLALLQRRSVDEPGGDFLRARGNGHVEGVSLDRIAVPDQFLAAGQEMDVRDQVHRAARAVMPRKPFGQLQDQIGLPGGDRDGLGHAEQAALHVGRIDVQLDRAWIGHVAGGGNVADGRNRLGRRARHLADGGGGGHGYEQRSEEGCEPGRKLHGQRLCRVPSRSATP